MARAPRRGQPAHCRAFTGAYGWLRIFRGAGACLSRPPTTMQQPHLAPLPASPPQAWTVPLMSRRQQLVFRSLVGVWLISLAWFWTWWFRSDHVVTWIGMAISTVLIGWAPLLPAWFFFFAWRMRRTNPALELPSGRIAAVVTKAPSEPWPMVRAT